MRFLVKIITFFLLMLALPFGCNKSQNSILSMQQNAARRDSTQTTVQNDWHVVAEGLRYIEISVNVANKDQKSRSDQKIQQKEFLIAQIDPKKFVFRIYQNLGGTESIRQIHEKTASLLSFNGSFFDEKFRPLGLLISDNKKLHAFAGKGILNGVFTIDRDGIGKLYYPAADLNEQNHAFAIQNGPVLIDTHSKIRIQNESGKTVSRTVLALDNNGNVIMIIIRQNLFNTENTLSLYQLARILKESPEFNEFGLRSALNLDGGSSSGAVINGHYLPEMSPVQNVVLVLKKQ